MAYVTNHLRECSQTRHVSVSACYMEMNIKHARSREVGSRRGWHRSSMMDIINDDTRIQDIQFVISMAIEENLFMAITA